MVGRKLNYITRSFMHSEYKKDEAVLRNIINNNVSAVDPDSVVNLIIFYRNKKTIIVPPGLQGLIELLSSPIGELLDLSLKNFVLVRVRVLVCVRVRVPVIWFIQTITLESLIQSEPNFHI